MHRQQSSSLFSPLQLPKKNCHGFHGGCLVEVKEPTLLVIHMLSATTLTLKSFVVADLYWAMVQTGCFIFFQVKSLSFGQCAINIGPVNLTLSVHVVRRHRFCIERTFVQINKGQ